MTELKADNFVAEALNSDVPVLVDFYAPWCGPCRMLAPVLEQLAGEFAGRVRFVKVNVDDTPELAQRYRITGVPTLMVFQGGKAVDTMVGFAGAGALRSRLEKVAQAAPQTASAA